MADIDTFLPDAPKKKRRITENDWEQIASFIKDEYERRKNDSKRTILEKKWKEIDRQIAMDARPRLTADGKPIAGTAWMPAVELPLQAETLEVLDSDAARLQFPDDRNFFSAHAGLDDKTLSNLEGSFLVPGLGGMARRLIEGLFGGKKTKITQDDMDALVEGALTHFHSLWRHREAWGLLNVEAFKYGTSIGSARMARLDKFSRDFRGVFKENLRIPVLSVHSIKSTYLDPSPMAALQEGLMTSPGYIYARWHRLDDLKLAAAKGSREPTREDGGWMPNRLKNMEAENANIGAVLVLMYEGDLLVSRKTGPSMFFPNVLVDIVVSRGGPVVFRYREREFPFNSHIENHYHREDAESAYSSSPLMKGAPLHAGATEALNRVLQSTALNTEPPMSWDPSDPYLQSTGGPVVEPRAQWETALGVTVHKIGDPAGLLAVYQELVRQYKDVTGTHAPRLGAQTKSHQSAFAVDVEQTRGVTRTVDYIRATMTGAMQTWLSMEYHMLRKKMGPTRIYVPKYQSYVEITRDMLPEDVTFDVHGAAGPIEEREKQASKQNALALAMQIEPLKLQTGGKPIDYAELQKLLLREGGFTNVDTIFASDVAPEAGGVEAGFDLPVDTGELGEGTPEDVSAQLAALSGQR